MIHSDYGPTGYVELSEFNIPVPDGSMLESISGYGFTVKYGEPAEEWWCIDGNFVEKQNPNIHALPMPLPYGLKTNKATYTFSLEKTRVCGKNKYEICHFWETKYAHCHLRYDGILCWTFHSSDNLTVKEIHSDGFRKTIVYVDFAHKRPIKHTTNKAFFNGSNHVGRFIETWKYDDKHRKIEHNGLDGKLNEWFYDGNSLVRHFERNPDGSSEEAFFENNEHQYSIFRDENGVETRIDY